MSLPCFALLDDSRHSEARSESPRSRLYTDYRATLSCTDASGMAAMLENMQAAQRHGLHAVALFSYELGAGMHGIAPHDGPQGPAAAILLFADCRRLTAEQTTVWLQQQENAEQATVAGIADVRASVDEQRFTADIARIRDYIAAGDTYQVNYTYRLHFDAYGAPVGLYNKLRARQPVPYGALICLPDERWVLSLSPELFARHTQGKLLAQPMKGTAPAHDGTRDNEQENLRRADRLSHDEKNRAENLMIVDLLRNDLGRIAVAGSVAVPHLFAVERFGQVLQMTSTITAQLREDAGIAEVVAALYPCGSITGAPKRRTMQIIRELETSPRGLYTGAIGWFDAAPPGKAVGDFCLSVPIRTLVLQAPLDGVRKGEMGVGAGIVHDSKAAEEFAECRLKAGFLTGLDSGFSLFETIHATREGGCRHLDRHMQRLRCSAAYFNFLFDETAIRSALTTACAQLPTAQPHRLRLDLFRDGAIRLQQGALSVLDARIKVFISPTPTRSDDLFLRHKTSIRTIYDDAWKDAERRGGFDTLFFNERDELTEGGRSNVFAQLDGRWYTPPLAAGALPGVMRSVLLDDPAWAASERVITCNDLRNATSVMLCNALRGALPAEIVWDDPA
ncbi:chorismate-binding protein [Herbaspirillum sp. RV1423]|uniref:chorismate-binding protein n=1 Tax=Herbaspirillum sp. RV1423 TaxID=1443993 RepID=UPI0004AD0FA8|nr:bifunctional anthranilate synthase component I family protein/class IV aminotransferase [Herbaspirillum sp. RV1423]